MASKRTPTDPIVDPVLGELHWDKQLEWWRSELKFRPGQTVKVSILESDPGPVIETRRAMFLRVRDGESTLRAQTATQMLEMAEDWRDADEEPDPITPESFASRVKLQAITLYDDGSAELYYDDDEIFAGHTIVVQLNPNGELEAANIAG